MSREFTLGACAVISNEKGEYLLVQRRDNNKWVTPGGQVEAGETPQAAVVREVKEESGFDVEVKELCMMVTKGWVNNIVLVFRCEILGGKPTLNDEAQAIEFFALDKLPEGIHIRHKDILVECDRQQTGTILKHYETDPGM